MRNFDDSDHLLFHGKAYLKAARLCLCEIMHDRHSWCENNERVPDSFKPIHYFIDDLLPPALYSIQHGIEVCFKAILLDAGISIKKFSHRTNDLFIAVKEYVLKTDWEPITINKWQELITQEEIDRIKNQVFSELEPLVDYFFYNEILFTKLGREKNLIQIMKFSDIQNLCPATIMTSRIWLPKYLKMTSRISLKKLIKSTVI